MRGGAGSKQSLNFQMASPGTNTLLKKRLDPAFGAQHQAHHFAPHHASHHPVYGMMAGSHFHSHPYNTALPSPGASSMSPLSPYYDGHGGALLDHHAAHHGGMGAQGVASDSAARVLLAVRVGEPTRCIAVWKHGDSTRVLCGCSDGSIRVIKEVSFVGIFAPINDYILLGHTQGPVLSMRIVNNHYLLTGAGSGVTATVFCVRLSGPKLVRNLHERTPSRAEFCIIGPR
jgi:hypothetical protein